MSTAVFSLPVLDVHRSHLKRPSPSSTKKRKRSLRASLVTSNTAANTGDNDLLQEIGDQPASSKLEYSAVISPEQRTQFRVAGQPFDEVVPQPPFPHAAHARSGETREPSSTSARSFSFSDNSRAFTKATAAPTLHLQHLAAITAVLHRCLLEHDYDRASRALGLILRERVGGRAVDVRNDSRWGIGAEVLLRRGTAYGEPQEAMGDDTTSASRQMFCTKKGFEDAKRYYERLIIQYPFHKPNAGAVSALDFYPALFGLWIYVAHQEGKIRSRLAPSRGEEEDASSSSSVKSSANTTEGAHEKELGQARAIASRMDVCMSTVPYNDSPELIRLRGMVALWTADLLEAAETERGEHTVEQQSMDAITGDVSRMNIGAADEASGMSEFALSMEASSCRRMAQDLFHRLNGIPSGNG